MKYIKKLINSILKKDYISEDSKLFIKYRNKILNSKNKILKLLYINKYNKILYKNNSSIPISSVIGKKLVLPHGLSGIFISVGAKIGDNCTIFQQVTIGSNTLQDSQRKGAPMIGNNVYIGAGAKIIGNIKIGDNVRIGANAVVVEDVPDNATVVGIKSRIIEHKESRNNKFIKYGEL